MKALMIVFPLLFGAAHAEGVCEPTAELCLAQNVTTSPAAPSLTADDNLTMLTADDSLTTLVASPKVTDLNVPILVTHRPTPVITLVPPPPISVDDTTPKGATCATINVTTDTTGVPFTGTLSFVAPNMNAGGIFALQPNGTTPASWLLVIDPAGPGIGIGPATDNITLEAKMN